MRAISLLALMLIASCGRYTTDIDSSRVGETKSITPVAVDATTVSKICEAIALKVPSTLSGTQANFTVQRKGCDDEKMSDSSDINTT
ncbi:MAG: hypothetical protein H0V66_06655, partial [Bdellovibrionales bacterium]|nr:hypothetical protein [Bdellovibrionales bacterium]